MDPEANPYPLRGTARIVIDAQAGSCGKGKTAEWLSRRFPPRVAVSTFGPNAGHTIQIGERKLVLRHLPAAALLDDTLIYLAASAVIDPRVLAEEVAHVEGHGVKPLHGRLLMHPRAAVIWLKHRELEGSLIGIASTMKGIGAALADKVMRHRNIVANDPVLSWYCRPIEEKPSWLSDVLACGGDIQIETSQGFDLCINHGIEYPHCTSRQIGVCQALADCGLPRTTKTVTYAVVRPFPIRVGNTKDPESGVSYSSGGYGDSTEITWEQIADSAGIPTTEMNALREQETTTVSKRLRRVFTFSWTRFFRFAEVNQPDFIVLNFADQLDWKARGVTSLSELPPRVTDFVALLERVAPVVCVGTGPASHECVELGGAR